MRDSDFESAWEKADSALAGPPLPSAAQHARILLWRSQEWHGWFRWWLCQRGYDWSRPLWLVTLASGLALLILHGMRTQRWEITAGGVVAWFTVVNLGFFSYLGLTQRPPPRPVPGPFPAGKRVRAKLGLYPPGYDGRKLARLWLRIPAEGAAEEWLLELACPDGLPPALEELCRRQTTFRVQRGDAPAMRAVCETVAITRANLDRGAHPVDVRAWHWDEQSTETFGRPA